MGSLRKFRLPYQVDNAPSCPGIYKITQFNTGRIYIGSSVNIKKRLIDHFRLLSRNYHYNSKIKDDAKKYGGHTFVAEILEICYQEVPLSKLREVEYQWQNKLQSSKGTNYNRKGTILYRGHNCLFCNDKVKILRMCMRHYNLYRNGKLEATLL